MIFACRILHSTPANIPVKLQLLSELHWTTPCSILIPWQPGIEERYPEENFYQYLLVELPTLTCLGWSWHQTQPQRGNFGCFQNWQRHHHPWDSNMERVRRAQPKAYRAAQEQPVALWSTCGLVQTTAHNIQQKEQPGIFTRYSIPQSSFTEGFCSTEQLVWEG